ncbi:MAG TPA: hypothetical protein VFX98_08805 [Longimicrobiaceae bacterium]|nr:hypothetical protein [Longimicrobiaceae bacterium]
MTSRFDPELSIALEGEAPATRGGPPAGTAPVPASTGAPPRGGLFGSGVGLFGGALGGFLVGGPVGAVAGALLGGAAGAPAGDMLGAERRRLTEAERAEARLVFGDTLDLDRVVVAGAPVMSLGRIARALPHAIYFPVDVFRAGIPVPWLVHELTHAWQYQHGVSLATTLFHAVRRIYKYGGADGLRSALAEGRRFTDFNTEQQGDILRDYYRRLKRGEDVAAWEPFVAQVRAAGPPRRR